jgi:hypothetical protein
VQSVRRPVERTEEERHGSPGLRHANRLLQDRLRVGHVLERVERADQVELRLPKRHRGRVGLDEAHTGASGTVVEQGVGEIEAVARAPALARWQLTIPSAQAISSVLPGAVQQGSKHTDPLGPAALEGVRVVAIAAPASAGLALLQAIKQAEVEPFGRPFGAVERLARGPRAHSGVATLASEQSVRPERHAESTI